MKNIFVVIDEIEDNTLVLWIAGVQLLFSLKWQADRSEREYMFLRYFDHTRPIEGIDKGIACVCLS